MLKKVENLDEIKEKVNWRWKIGKRFPWNLKVIDMYFLYGQGLLYNMDMVQDAIAATFPCSLCYLQVALHENKMLMDFIPR